MATAKYAPIRNAYGKIRLGDQIAYKTWGGTEIAVVTAKEGGQIVLDTGKSVMGTDVIAIVRDGLTVERAA